MADAPKERIFTATHGAKFADTGPKNEYQPWAHFTRDHGREVPNGPMVFSFATSDAKVAGRLAKVTDYGITEVTP
jgi:hypothetical protein